MSEFPALHICSSMWSEPLVYHRSNQLLLYKVGHEASNFRHIQVASTIYYTYTSPERLARMAGFSAATLSQS